MIPLFDRRGTRAGNVARGQCGVVAVRNPPLDPGWFRSYLTIIVKGGLMRFPTVLYSLMV